jgi:hypothetical protein
VALSCRLWRKQRLHGRISRLAHRCHLWCHQLETSEPGEPEANRMCEALGLFRGSAASNCRLWRHRRGPSASVRRHCLDLSQPGQGRVCTKQEGGYWGDVCSEIHRSPPSRAPPSSSAYKFVAYQQQRCASGAPLRGAPRALKDQCVASGHAGKGHHMCPMEALYTI